MTNCETDGLNESKVKKNSEVEIKHLRREIDGLNGVQKHEIVYSGMEKLDRSFNDLSISDPGLVFDQSSSTLSKRNEFDDDRLDELMRSSTIPRHIPTRYYPFSPEDSLAVIGQNVLRHLMSESVSREDSGEETDGGQIDAKEIAKEIHDYWPLLSKDGKAQIVGKIDHVLSKFEDENMGEDMRKLEKSDRTYYVRTSQSFRRKCKNVLDELEEEESQKKLDYWMDDN
ncbi:hypothetical protein [Natrinema sp. CGMCC1.2065]|uniref:hypothetical protein n=1 Tax=Natrinema sp. CGMCC1.2065 TaxID=3445767 RepID=UPI003F4A7797